MCSANETENKIYFQKKSLSPSQSYPKFHRTFNTKVIKTHPLPPKKNLFPPKKAAKSHHYKLVILQTCLKNVPSKNNIQQNPYTTAKQPSKLINTIKATCSLKNLPKICVIKNNPTLVKTNISFHNQCIQTYTPQNSL